MPNAIKMLQDDHNSVRIVCKHLPTIQPGARGEEEKAALQLVSMLRTHCTLEEELVYPILAEIDPGMMKQSVEDHLEADEILAQIEALPDRVELFEAVARLWTAVERHVTEEEKSVFPLLSETLGLSGLEDLGLQMATRQQELMQASPDVTGAAGAGSQKVVTPRI